MKENYYELQQSLTSWQRQKCSPFTNTEGTIWIDLTAFKQEITKWRHHWSIGPPDDPLSETLVETLDQSNAASVCRNLCGSYNTSYFPYFGVRCWVQFQLDEKTKDFTT